MAVLVKPIEREFLLATAMRERTPVTMVAGGGEWSCRIVSVSTTHVSFDHDIPLSLLKKGAVYDFRYNVRGQTIAFRAAIIEPGDKRCTIAMPEKVYKNLSRRYIRLPPPGDLAASFQFEGERYDLDFPSSTAFVPSTEPETSASFDPSDLRGLMAEFENQALSVASDRGIVMFKDRKPERVEERLCAATGRCFYVPTAIAGIPRSDPFADRAILTRDDFLTHYIDGGLEPAFAEDEVVRFERSIRTAGILSELIVPILFQSYVIGYASVVNRQVGKPPFGLDTVEKFMAFARVFAWSLKVHGYFKDAPRLDQSYGTQVVDVSAGGLLFLCQDPKLIEALKAGSPVSVRLESKRRAINASGIIRRHYVGKDEGYFGIEFSAMEPEDFRFLFEYLYGRPFTDEDAQTVEGIRIHSP